MPLSIDDKLAIHELISLHGHVMDNGQLDRLDELFTADVAYDLSQFGMGILTGVDAIREAALRLGAANPVGHHVTNIVVGAADGNRVEVVSKGIGIRADGTCGSVAYEDLVQHLPQGWRITRRKVTARRAPLQP